MKTKILTLVLTFLVLIAGRVCATQVYSEALRTECTPFPIYQPLYIFSGDFVDLYTASKSFPGVWKYNRNVQPVITKVMKGTVSLSFLDEDPSEAGNFFSVAKRLAPDSFPESELTNRTAKQSNGADFLLPVRICGGTHPDMLVYILNSNFREARKDKKFSATGVMPPSIHYIPEFKSARKEQAPNRSDRG